jgi:transcriptional regulator with XRE-family HTH domain
MSVDLRAERINRGLSLDAMADAIDVPKSTLARAERRDSVPVPAVQLKIAGFFGYLPSDVWPTEDRAAA